MTNVLYYIVIGFIVSMDAMALTVGKKSTYESRWWPTLVSWCALNALWHSGLLVLYVFLFHYILELLRAFFDWIPLSWIEFNFPDILFPQFVVWLLAKLKLHLFSIFAAVAILLVWTTYSRKIVDTPMAAGVGSLPTWMRPIFRLLRRGLENTTFNLNLQAALVAVDMLALAALLKASDQSASSSDKIIMAIVVAVAVFVFTLGSAAFARARFSEETPVSMEGVETTAYGRGAAKIWVLVTLRLLEPLLIFYFLIQLLAAMSTGVHIDSPSLLFAAVIMVAAIVQQHGLARICAAVLASERQG